MRAVADEFFLFPVYRTHNKKILNRPTLPAGAFPKDFEACWPQMDDMAYIFLKIFHGHLSLGAAGILYGAISSRINTSINPYLAEQQVICFLKVTLNKNISIISRD